MRLRKIVELLGLDEEVNDVQFVNAVALAVLARAVELPLRATTSEIFAKLGEVSGRESIGNFPLRLTTVVVRNYGGWNEFRRWGKLGELSALALHHLGLCLELRPPAFPKEIHGQICLTPEKILAMLEE